MRMTALLLLALAFGVQNATGQERPRSRAFVAAEAIDKIYAIDFDGQAARIRDTWDIGINPMDPDGPHGLGLSPDGRVLYVSTAHGSPSGSLWKLDAETGWPLARVELGPFPASLQASPDGAYVFVVNFNLHGDMVPSSVSVVAADDMVEVARTTTCTMPHGSRLNGAGTKQYSTCMMDDMLIEIDTRSFAVSRHFELARGHEMGMDGPPHTEHHRPAAGAANAAGGHGMDHAPAGNTACSPTWAQPLPDGSRIFVACNRSSEIVEIDATAWRVVRRLPAGDGVYNLGVTRDGRTLIATNKRGQSVSIFDTQSGRELARIPTRRRVVHGVAVSADDRFAFVTVEGIGSEPGTLEIIDIGARRIVASVDVGQMAGGVDAR
jgi:DNA-binding beta-propeller fold protein YncE